MTTWTVLVYREENADPAFAGPPYEIAGNIDLDDPPRVGDTLTCPNGLEATVIWVTRHNYQIGVESDPPIRPPDLR